MLLCFNVVLFFVYVSQAHLLCTGGGIRGTLYLRCHTQEDYYSRQNPIEGPLSSLLLLPHCRIIRNVFSTMYAKLDLCGNKDLLI